MNLGLATKTRRGDKCHICGDEQTVVVTYFTKSLKERSLSLMGLHRLTLSGFSLRIGHFRIPLSLSFKARLSAKFLL